MSVHHADVVGSLLAPRELAAAISYPPVREVTAAEPCELQDRAIDQALAVQQRAEVDVVSDGEPRRIQFFDPCGFESGTNAPLSAAQGDKLKLVVDVAHSVRAAARS